MNILLRGHVSIQASKLWNIIRGNLELEYFRSDRIRNPLCCYTYKFITLKCNSILELQYPAEIYEATVPYLFDFDDAPAICTAPEGPFNMKF